MPDDAAIKDFLNPKSMLTPGIAGGITMLIGNTLWVQFGLQPKWAGLVISFVLALLVFTTIEIVLWQRVAYWLLNSLIIFSVGLGANSLGATSVAGTKIGTSGGNECRELMDRVLERLHILPQTGGGGIPSDAADEPRRPGGSQRRRFFNGDWDFISETSSQVLAVASSGGTSAGKRRLSRVVMSSTH
jgi:hypothetical protein